MCGLLGFASGELGPAVISRIGSKSGDYYENTYPRSDSLLTDVHRSYSATLLRPDRRSLHRKVAANGGQRCGEWKRTNINLTGLAFVGPFGPAPGIRGNPAYIMTGAGAGSGAAGVDGYRGFTGPASFGSGGFFAANTSSGDFVGINIPGGLFVPNGYVSGAALSDSMTFNNATLASLGVTPGTYVWTWGTGLPNQNFTLVIGGVGVPDGGSTVSLLGFALLGLVALRRKLRC